MPSCPMCKDGRATERTADGKLCCRTCFLRQDAKARAKAEASAQYKAMVKQMVEELKAEAQREAAETVGKSRKA